MENKEVRLIDANKLKLVYEDWIAKMEDCPIDVCADECQAIYDCIWELNAAPTIDPESLRQHGKWIMRGGKRYCSHCGERACVTRDSDDFWYTVGTPSCPNCGAKMDKED